jgi:hypothetical protein
MILEKRMIISKWLGGAAAPPPVATAPGLGVGLGYTYYVNELQRPLNS